MAGLAQSLQEMMNQHVLPYAQRDTMADLRGMMLKQRELRHVVFMYRHLLKVLGACRRREWGLAP